MHVIIIDRFRGDMQKKRERTELFLSRFVEEKFKLIGKVRFILTMYSSVEKTETKQNFH
jgi:hypothetical protein